MLPPVLIKIGQDLDYDTYQLKQSIEKLNELRQQQQSIAEQIANEEQRFIDINRRLINHSGEMIKFLKDNEKDTK